MAAWKESPMFNVSIEDTAGQIIAFTTEGFSEHLLLECELRNISDTAIGDTYADNDDVAEVYGMDGVKRNSLKRGYNILKMKSGKTRKLFVQ